MQLSFVKQHSLKMAMKRSNKGSKIIYIYIHIHLNDCNNYKINKKVLNLHISKYALKLKTVSTNVCRFQVSKMFILVAPYTNKAALTTKFTAL